MNPLPPTVTPDDLAAYAAGSSAIVESDGAEETKAVGLALAAAESFGARWVGYGVDSFHVHRRTDDLFVLESLGGRTNHPYAYAPVRPVVQVTAVDGRATVLPADASWTTEHGAAIVLPAATGAVPGGYVSVDTFCGYAPTGESTEALRQLGGLGGLDVLAVVPELAAPLRTAVCESALAILTRAESGSIGKTESEFQASTFVRKTVRLVRDPLREIWETYATAYRILT